VYAWAGDASRALAIMRRRRVQEADNWHRRLLRARRERPRRSCAAEQRDERAVASWGATAASLNPRQCFAFDLLERRGTLSLLV